MSDVSRLKDGLSLESKNLITFALRFFEPHFCGFVFIVALPMLEFHLMNHKI